MLKETSIQQVDNLSDATGTPDLCDQLWKLVFRNQLYKLDFSDQLSTLD